MNHTATRTPAPHYAGVGSRKTPPAFITAITHLASQLSHHGWHLRSGGAAGADNAFARPLNHTQRTLYVPNTGYNHWPPELTVVPTTAQMRCLRTIAASYHPAWDRCSPFAKAVHARNVAIVLGPDTNSPVQAVVCWTPNALVIGGTGQALRIALAHDIPIFNLANLHPRKITAALNALAPITPA